MRLTLQSDYSLRLLMFLAAKRGELASVPEIARAYGISQNHLVKVAHALVQLGYVATTRGRKGGLKLAKAPETITLGEVVRQTEESLSLVQCFSESDPGQGCRIEGACRLKGVLVEAQRAFFRVLDGATLSDLVGGQEPQLRRLLLVL
jgi:Rrf2 family transcriptional regulator, nitric oxide-sensitive transcriptional repressor